MVYIVENNGVYGLTKGQFSATADLGSKLKTGVVNDLPAIDLCAMAIELGCGYVARSFSGDMKQLLALLKGAIAHRGTALLDVISPCVTFNNHEDSTKSYKWAKDHEIPIQEIGFIPFFEEITVDYDPGTTQDVVLHDGSHIRLQKLRADYDADRQDERPSASCHEAQEKSEFLTGLIYVEPAKKDFLVALWDLPEEPLATLPLERARPGREALAQMMEEPSAYTGPRSPAGAHAPSLDVEPSPTAHLGSGRARRSGRRPVSARRRSRSLAVARRDRARWRRPSAGRVPSPG